MKIIKDFKIKKILSLFWGQSYSPYFNAKGIAVGVFSGCFPFFGLQTFLGLFIARLIKGNLLLAALGTWISNPFTYIPLYLLNFKVGSLFFKNHSADFLNKELMVKDFWNHGWFFTTRLLLGSCLVGIFLGSLVGLLTFYLYKSRSKENINQLYFKK